ncbi:MAG: hypothetical protein Q3972_07980 [Corynebacterium sp.]|nr:hypothetical protein [Corynebacterium sp.]
MVIRVLTDDGRQLSASNLRAALTALYDSHVVLSPTSPKRADVYRAGRRIGFCEVEGTTFNESLIDEIQARSHRVKKLAAELKHERDHLQRLSHDAYYHGLATQKELGTYLGVTSVAMGKILKKGTPGHSAQ